MRNFAILTPFWANYGHHSALKRISQGLTVSKELVRADCAGPDHQNSVGRCLSKIGLDDIRPKVSELLADDFHSFLAGEPAGMEFIHPHLRISMAQAVGAGGPSKVLDTGFGKDVGKGLPGRDVVMLLIIDAPVSESNRFRQTSQFEFSGQLSWKDHLAHQSALAFNRIDDASSLEKPIFRPFPVRAWCALRTTLEGIELMSPQTCSISDTCREC